MPANKKNSKANVKIGPSKKEKAVVLRIALAQINPVVGDFNFNSNKIKQHLKQARKMAADVVLFPELAVTGYPPEDLLLKERF